jgi:hypothetical protein
MSLMDMMNPDERLVYLIQHMEPDDAEDYISQLSNAKQTVVKAIMLEQMPEEQRMVRLNNLLRSERSALDAQLLLRMTAKRKKEYLDLVESNSPEQRMSSEKSLLGAMPEADKAIYLKRLPAERRALLEQGPQLVIITIYGHMCYN